MPDGSLHGVSLTGIGVVSAIGLNRQAFAQALRSGEHRFGVMTRAGRQSPNSRFIGAELPDDSFGQCLDSAIRRTSTLPTQAAVAALTEAWADAKLGDGNGARIGLVVGGSDLNRRALANTHARLAETPYYIRPRDSYAFLDTDICGVATSVLPIRAFAHTVGQGSASGQVAAIEAAKAVASGQVDVCIAIGALSDLSHWECHAYSGLGAMLNHQPDVDAETAYRPFDKRHAGFVYGEASAALVFERIGCRSEGRSYAQLSGWSVRFDGNREPNSNAEGICAAMTSAVAMAGRRPAEIDYVNPHGSGSIMGDNNEILALRAGGFIGATLNSTKSLTGHGLTAAGAIEIAATAIQGCSQFIHPSRNLDEPIDREFDWIRTKARDTPIRHAMSVSLGFGGCNTAICLDFTNSERIA